MSDSIWKKEITFRRKPSAPAEPAPAKSESFWKKEISFSRAKEPQAEPKPSIWKKEISLRRKREPEPVSWYIEPAPRKPRLEPEATGEELQREPSVVAAEPAQPEPKAELVASEQPGDELPALVARIGPTVEPTSWYVERLMQEQQPEAEPIADLEQPRAESGPEWSRVASEPAPAPEPTSWHVEPSPPAEQEAEAEWSAKVEQSHIEPEHAPWLATAAPVLSPKSWDVEPLSVPQEPQPDAEPLAELEHAHGESESLPWVTAPEPTAPPVADAEPAREPVAQFEEAHGEREGRPPGVIAPEPTPPPVSHPESAPAPVAEFERGHGEPEGRPWVIAPEPTLPPVLDAEPAPERVAEREQVHGEPEGRPWLTAPEPTPPPVAHAEPAPEPVTDLEPLREVSEREPWLAAAELPSQVEAPADDAELKPAVTDMPSKTSFWRKERSLKRTAKEPKLSAAVEPPVSVAEAVEPAEPKTSFWRRERSLKRTAKEPKLSAAVEPPVSVAALERPVEQKTSFWRKDRSLKRTPKDPKLTAHIEPKRSFLKRKRSLEGAPKQRKRRDTFWRRERSLTKTRMSVPKRASGAKGGGGGHPVKRVVGLKIGASQLAAARVDNNGAAELMQVAREPLAPGVIVGGELRDPEALADALKRFFARNKLPRKNVRLGIASNRIGVRVFEIAGIEDDKQLENAIRFRAQDTLPIPLDEAVLDFHVLGESVDDEGNTTRRVLLVVAYRELVDRYVAACRKAGISLSGIDLEAFALLRALAAPRPADQESDAAFVAVAIGHDRSTFAVSDGRVCEFTRVIDWGGASLSVAIARALDQAPSEVESVKRLLSLESEETPEGMAPEDYVRAVDAVRRQVQGFARELVSSLQFYQHQPGSLGIGEIVITGGTASLAGLAAELERLIGVRVRVGDPLARLKVGKKVSADEHLGSLAVAIGLGIED